LSFPPTSPTSQLQRWELDCTSKFYCGLFDIGSGNTFAYFIMNSIETVWEIQNKLNLFVLPVRHVKILDFAHTKICSCKSLFSLLHITLKMLLHRTFGMWDKLISSTQWYISAVDQSLFVWHICSIKHSRK
jgi:hypothetical protein